MKSYRLATIAMMAIIAIPSLASAQSNTFSAAYSLDLTDRHAKPAPVVAYNVRTFTDVFDRKGLNLDLVGLTTLSDNARIGFGVVYRLRKTIPFSKEFRPKIDLTVGPWGNYGTGSKTLRGGLFLGFGGSF